MTMKSLVVLILLAFTLFANPVQGGKYLTEAQKELLLEKSRALGLSKEKANAQNAIEWSELVKFLLKTPMSSSAIVYNPISHTSSVVNIARSQTQSLQSIFKNTHYGTPAYSNRPVNQSQQGATKAYSSRPVKQSRQVATKASRSKWSSFFKNLSVVASAINSGMNQTNSQFKPYIQQPNNQSFGAYSNGNKTYGSSGNQIIHTMSVGNQTINVGGNHELRTWDVGNQTFGTFDSKEVKMYNFGNFSHGTIGGQKVRCHKAGELKFCK